MAITAHAETAGENRYELEQTVKRAVRADVAVAVAGVAGLPDL
ncbi:hypothetical protein [Streptomyces sp. NPDC007905]